MPYIWMGAERFAECSTIALSIFFFYRCMYTKVNRKSYFYIITAAYILIRLIFYFMGWKHREYFALGVLFLYGRFSFRGNIWTHFLWALMPGVTDGIVDAVTISTYMLFPCSSYEGTISLGWPRTILLIVSKTILFGVYYVITIGIEKNKNIKSKNLFLLLIIPISCWIILEVLFRYENMVKVPLDNKMLPVMGSISLLLLIIASFTLYNSLVKQEMYLDKVELQLRITDITHDYIDKINDTYDQLSRVKHDLKNHFIAISNYIQVENNKAAQNYINELINVDAIMQNYVGHPVTDSILNAKASVFKKANIEFTARVILPNRIPISDVDLCIIFSNLLDNAYEATEKQHPGKNRFIELTASPIDCYWAITCKNSTYNYGIIQAEGSLISTKKVQGFHGVGTKQIQDIAEKTSGFVTYRHEGYIFIAAIIIKLPQIKK